MKTPAKARNVVGRRGEESLCCVTPRVSYGYFGGEMKKNGENGKEEEKRRSGTCMYAQKQS